MLQARWILAAAAAILAHVATAGQTPGEARDLLVEDYDPSTGSLSLSWAPACGAADHHIEFGDLAGVGEYDYSGQACGIGTTGSYAGFAPGPGSVFFIVVANDGAGTEGSYGTALGDAGSMERPADLLDPTCAFVQDLAQRCDVPVLELTAYRPVAPPLQRRAVPDDLEVRPGVGVRVNGDDDDGSGTPDADDGTVTGEDDLIEVVLHASPATAPAGFEYVLRRSDPGVRIWELSSKGTELLASSDSAPITVGRGFRTVWIECPQGVGARVEFLVRRLTDPAALGGDEVELYPFGSIVIALGGENQVPADPPLEPGNHGMFQVGIDLVERGYDVRILDEDTVAASGAGVAFNEVAGAVGDRAVEHVAIFGYSHGGGSTHDLARLLDDNREAIGSFTIDFTAYVDGIDNDSDIDIRTETELPPATLYHANWYENPGCGLFELCGGPVAGADFDLNVNTAPWGMDLGHFTIDDAPEVKAGLRDQLIERVPR